MNHPTVDPHPALRICYTTSFGTITDPKLYTTLHQCLDTIAVRQRDFSTTLTVTVTDITTAEMIYETHYDRPVPHAHSRSLANATFSLRWRMGTTILAS